MNSYNVTDLKEGTYFTKEVVLDKNFLLLNSTIPVSEKLIRALLDWEFRQVHSEGNISTGAIKAEIPQVKEQIRIIDKTPETEIPDMGSSEQARMAMVQTVYNEFMAYIDQIFTTYATQKVLNLNEISDNVKDLCIFIKENRRYVLRIQPSVQPQNKNFLVSHSMRSTVFAIVIGLQLRLPLTKLIELGVACILHEIGMIRLPPQLYLTDRTLTPAEKKAIFTHPLISYNILKSYSFPLNICLGVLEHHEKENGTGYPRKIPGDKISLYAKIIAVACSFEAITSSRYYKEAANPYDGIVEILKNSGQQFDETIVRALLYALSLFPIGSYVLLSDNRTAQVIDINPENPKNPVVQITGTADEDGNPLTVETGKDGVIVVRALTKEETAELTKEKPDAGNAENDTETGD